MEEGGVKKASLYYCVGRDERTREMAGGGMGGGGGGTPGANTPGVSLVTIMGPGDRRCIVLLGIEPGIPGTCFMYRAELKELYTKRMRTRPHGKTRPSCGLMAAAGTKKQKKKGRSRRRANTMNSVGGYTVDTPIAVDAG